MPSAPAALWPSTDAGIASSRAQGLHTLTPTVVGTPPFPISLSLFCLQTPEHDWALCWSLDSRKASHSSARQHSPTELQHPHTHCQPSPSRGTRAPLERLSPAPRLTFNLPPARGVAMGQAIRLQ